MFLISSFLSCNKKDNVEMPEHNLFVSGHIKANTGGSIENGTGIKITFPPDGLPSDGEVKIGIRGDEPSTVENTKLKIIGKPFTIVLPVDTLKKTALIEFPKPDNFTSADEIAYFAFNGKTYMPLYYEVRSSKIEVKLDIINYVKEYKSTMARGLNPAGELIIIGVIYKQTPPINQMGLKQVSVGSDGKLGYTDVGTISTNDKCLIFIHGWFSSPDTWEKFIPLFIPKSNVGYTKILTFGYNSSLPINDNGQILANLLSSKFQGIQVDIVGHSMGGLVSRSAIENHNASAYVKNLVTLGTPHKGSPLAALRYLLGVLVALDGIPEYITYNMNTQGFKDLFPLSNFMTQLNSNPPSSVPYYAIAAENEPCRSYIAFIGSQFHTVCFPSSLLVLEGNDDGVVAKTSALGIVQNNNIGLPTELFLNNTFLAHTAMVHNEGFVNLVASYLNSQNQTNPANGLIAHYPFDGNANDASGNNNNGTISGGVSLTQDRKNNSNSAYLFNGADGFIAVPASGTLNSISKQTDATFCYWYKTDNWYNAGAFLCKANNADDLHYRFYVNDAISTVLQVEQSFASGSFTSLENNKWYFFAGVKSGNTAKLYIDGVLISSSQMSNDTWPSNINTDLEIGRDVHGNDEYTRGAMDDIRIYNRALTQAEITALKNQ